MTLACPQIIIEEVAEKSVDALILIPSTPFHRDGEIRGLGIVRNVRANRLPAADVHE
jgi:hypothetical protein